MTYLDHAGHRERVWRAFNTGACAPPWDNRPLVTHILSLRRDKARLLGFDGFADLVLEDRMAKTGARARAFVEDLRARAHAAFVAENEALLAFRREVEGREAPLCSRGTWATGPRSSGVRGSTSTRRRCGPTSRCRG